MTLSAREVLLKAADLIEPEGKWTQGEFARNAYGEPVAASSPAAVCWCVRGALSRAAPSVTAFRAVEPHFLRVIGLPRGTGVAWNDTPGRTQAEVVAALRAAAEEAK